jgi:hypothetical protein
MSLRISKSKEATNTHTNYNTTALVGDGNRLLTNTTWGKKVLDRVEEAFIFEGDSNGVLLADDWE